MDFRFRRGASDEHTLQGSVRSEQRSLNRKDTPPGGLRRSWLLARCSPACRQAGQSQPHFGGCSFVAPRQKPTAAQQMPTQFVNGTLAQERLVESTVHRDHLARGFAQAIADQQKKGFRLVGG